jgi:hypothetical protein
MYYEMLGEVVSSNIYVHPRIAERHPEISEKDVLDAWKNFVRMQRRQHPKNDQVVAVGFDSRGRQLEMVATVQGIDSLVYHAVTPPTKSILEELNLARR